MSKLEKSNIIHANTAKAREVIEFPKRNIKPRSTVNIASNWPNGVRTESFSFLNEYWNINSATIQMIADIAMSQTIWTSSEYEINSWIWDSHRNKNHKKAISTIHWNTAKNWKSLSETFPFPRSRAFLYVISDNDVRMAESIQ